MAELNHKSNASTHRSRAPINTHGVSDEIGNNSILCRNSQDNNSYPRWKNSLESVQWQVALNHHEQFSDKELRLLN